MFWIIYLRFTSITVSGLFISHNKAHAWSSACRHHLDLQCILDYEYFLKLIKHSFPSAAGNYSGTKKSVAFSKYLQLSANQLVN